MGVLEAGRVSGGEPGEGPVSGAFAGTQLRTEAWISVARSVRRQGGLA